MAKPPCGEQRCGGFLRQLPRFAGNFIQAIIAMNSAEGRLGLPATDKNRAEQRRLRTERLVSPAITRFPA